MNFRNAPVSLQKLAIEIFSIVNLGFLSVDIWLAHSVNGFHHKAEWIPFALSITAPALLLPGLFSGKDFHKTPWARSAGFLVGWLCLATGFAGMIYHLQSQFFQLKNLHSLVYTAPFVAPLAYAGLGFLLILNRSKSVLPGDYPRYILFFAWAGWGGNFVLSLADHAQNDFHHPAEWIAVAAAALAFSFSLVALPRNTGKTYLQYTAGVMVLQIAVGTAGFALHLIANLQTETNIWESFVYGAPLFAPLLFANLALLALIGLWGRFYFAKDEN